VIQCVRCLDTVARDILARRRQALNLGVTDAHLIDLREVVLG